MKSSPECALLNDVSRSGVEVSDRNKTFRCPIFHVLPARGVCRVTRVVKRSQWMTARCCWSLCRKIPALDLVCGIIPVGRGIVLGVKIYGLAHAENGCTRRQDLMIFYYHCEQKFQRVITGFNKNPSLNCVYYLKKNASLSGYLPEGACDSSSSHKTEISVHSKTSQARDIRHMTAHRTPLKWEKHQQTLSKFALTKIKLNATTRTELKGPVRVQFWPKSQKPKYLDCARPV